MTSVERGAGRRGLDERGARILTHVVYGLQAAAVINGVTMILGVILNYVKREDVRGTFLESHFRWQITTFWVAFVAFLLLSTLATAGALTMRGEDVVVGGGVFILALLVGLALLVLLIYVYYRIVRGWLALLEDRPVQ